MNTAPILCALLATSSAAAAQSPIVLVRDADVIAGVGSVTSIENLAVNASGSWIVELDTDHASAAADGLLLRDGVVALRQGDPLAAPAGAAVGSFGTVSINGAGESSWNLFLEVTSGPDSGIYFGTTLVIAENATSTSPSFGAGTVYTGFFGTKTDDARRILIVASVDDPLIASSTDRAIVLAQVDANGALLSETVLHKEGDAVAGIPGETIADFGTGPHDFALNGAGRALYSADLTPATVDDGVILLDTTVVAREGDPSPVAGRAYETLYGQSLDLGDGGDWVFRANLDGATTDDDVIVVNGTTVVAREGSGLPSIGAFTITSFGTGPVRVDAGGNVYWYGDWNDPDTTRDTGIFRNGELIVQEGVTQTSGGETVFSISAVQDAFSISPDGRWLIFEGRVQNGTTDAAFLLDVGSATTAFCFGDGSATPCPCGNAGAAGNGCASSVAPGGANLSAGGSPSLSADTLVLAGSSMPNSSALYFQGTTRQNGGNGSVFGDGLRCAGGSVIRLATKFNAGGASSYPGPGDPSIHVRGLVAAPGTRTYQTWYRNAAIFCTASTFNLSNGLEVSWSP